MRNKLHDGPSEAFEIMNGRVRRSTKPRASISALQWAAERAGKSYGMFCLGLTPADEAQIQQEYEKYQQSRSAAARGVDIE